MSFATSLFSGPFFVWIDEWNDDLCFDRYHTAFGGNMPEWIWNRGGRPYHLRRREAQRTKGARPLTAEEGAWISRWVGVNPL